MDTISLASVLALVPDEQQIELYFEGSPMPFWFGRKCELTRDCSNDVLTGIQVSGDELILIAARWI